MTSRPVRITTLVVGVLALIIGGVWIGQGLGIIPGSVMSGDRTWFYVGTLLAAVGIVLLVLSLRRAQRRP